MSRGGGKAVDMKVVETWLNKMNCGGLAPPLEQMFQTRNNFNPRVLDVLSLDPATLRGIAGRSTVTGPAKENFMQAVGQPSTESLAATVRAIDTYEPGIDKQIKSSVALPVPDWDDERTYEQLTPAERSAEIRWIMDWPVMVRARLETDDAFESRLDHYETTPEHVQERETMKRAIIKVHGKYTQNTPEVPRALPYALMAFTDTAASF